MLISMTGYGRATGSVRNQQIRVEIKSVNSKFSEFRFRLPALIKDKEFEIRKLLTTAIDRGKVDFLIEQINGDSDEIHIDKNKFVKYADAIKALARQTGLKDDQILSSILLLPDVVGAIDEPLKDEEYAQIENTIQKAIEEFNQFRKHEGMVLADVIKQNVMVIQGLLEKVGSLETNRSDQLKQRLHKMMLEFSSRPDYDSNRFEQELIYYMEKMDFTEEKVRLGQHCKFFIEKLMLPMSNGRELNFISQEMGREINTLGSKAQDHTIQHIVVAMKDELEKIKEQLANVV